MVTGAEVLIKALEKEGVEYVFGYSGGAAMPIFDAIYDSKIKLILTRHEQGATHMADGYARATGKPGVVLVTSGPGATNTITGIVTANMDSVPIIVLTGQQITSMLGKDAFQETDIFGTTMPVVKHSFLIKDRQIIPRVIKEAFYIATTNRPGPVLIDLPKDVTAGEFDEKNYNEDMDLPGYHLVDYPIEMEKISAAAELINKSKRPLILVGHGVLVSGATKELKEFAEKIKSPVTNTLLAKGAFPETHELSLGMLGMHGTAYANKALLDCDLVINFGSRFDDRICGDPDRFCRQAKIIHVDIDQSEINKIMIPDVSIISDARKVLHELIKFVQPLNTNAWLQHNNRNKKRFPLNYKKKGGLRAQHIIKSLYEVTRGKAIITTDVGQHQMWAAQFYKTDEADKWITSGGAGTMGFGFPAAIGAQFGKPQDTVVAIVGDGGFQMTSYELSTIFIHKLPVKILVIDNKYLGMVRQWQELFYDLRYSGVDLEGNPDFTRLAKAYNVKAFRIKKASQTKKVLSDAIKFNGPCLIHAEVIKEDNVFPMIPSGQSAEDMIITPPTKKLEKPVGST